MFTVVGIQKSSGTFKGFDYDNVVLHCMYENESFGGFGVKTFKCPTKYVDTSHVNVNSVIDVHYNQYGKVASVHIIK